MSDEEDTVPEYAPLIQKSSKTKVPTATALPRKAKEVSFAKVPEPPKMPAPPTKIPTTPRNILTGKCTINPQTCKCCVFQKDGTEFRKIVTVCCIDVPNMILTNYTLGTSTMVTSGAHGLKSIFVVPVNFTGIHKAYWRQRLSPKHKLTVDGNVINKIVDGHCVSVEFLASDRHLTLHF